MLAPKTGTFNSRIERLFSADRSIDQHIANEQSQQTAEHGRQPDDSSFDSHEAESQDINRFPAPSFCDDTQYHDQQSHDEHCGDELNAGPRDDRQKVSAESLSIFKVIRKAAENFRKRSGLFSHSDHINHQARQVPGMIFHCRRDV